MDQFPTQQTHDRTKTKTKINPFLGCFGFSTKARNKNFPEKTRSDYHILKKKPLLLITWSTSRLKKSRSKRTVPVDAHTVSENPNLDKKINQLEKAKSKSDLIELVLPVVPEQNLPAKPQESSAQDIDLANQKQLDHLHAPKANKYRKLQSFSRKIDAIRNGSSQPGSPEDGRAKAKPSKIIPSLMRQYSAVSLPAQINQKQNKRVGLKKPNNRKSEGRLDPILGISVIMVTLIIMLLWGRLCAILCTSAWFYFIPMLTNTIRSNIGSDLDSKILDMNSQEYKKKVVLEGFLRRN